MANSWVLSPISASTTAPADTKNARAAPDIDMNIPSSRTTQTGSIAPDRALSQRDAAYTGEHLNFPQVKKNFQHVLRREKHVESLVNRKGCKARRFLASMLTLQ
jgi:hypothetical protein